MPQNQLQKALFTIGHKSPDGLKKEETPPLPRKQTAIRRCKTGSQDILAKSQKGKASEKKTQHFLEKVAALFPKSLACFRIKPYLCTRN